MRIAKTNRRRQQAACCISLAALWLVSAAAAPAVPADAPAASERATPVAPAVQSPEGKGRQLGVAALRGDAGALDKLAEMAAAMRTMNSDEQAAVRSDIRLAFEVLGTEAGKGNAAGLQALWQATRIPALKGFATEGLGHAAGHGNEEALKALLDPEGHHLLRSSAVSALRFAADAGNAQAIEALAATARDPKQRGLWVLAARGLAKAASTGNVTAIGGLATLAAPDNHPIIRDEAISALEAAARQGQPRAEEALRKLGLR